MEKLTGYCLNPEHKDGRHKARVFASVLGIRAEDAELLRAALLKAAREEEATLSEKDERGQRYVVDFTMSGPAGEAPVRSAWTIRSSEAFPRLITCYVRKKGHRDGGNQGA